MTAILAGLFVGLAGGGHCLLMCGPLAALEAPRSRPALYHAGRVLTYLALGLVAGLAGGLVGGLGLARPLSIAAGLVLVAHALGRGLGRQATGTRIGALVAGAIGRTMQWTRSLRLGRPFAFGVLNGLLPCGLVYGAMVGATGFGSPGAGLAFMLGFGAGTVPILAGASIASHLARRLPPRTLGRLVPVALALTGLLLIARGVVAPGATHAHAAAPAQAAAHVAPGR